MINGNNRKPIGNGKITVSRKRRDLNTNSTPTPDNITPFEDNSDDNEISTIIADECAEADDINYGIKYLIKKILLGDSSDNIKCCSIDNGYLDTGVPTNQYRNVYKTLATAIVNNPNKYELLKGILDKIRNGIIKNDSDSQISFVKNFYNNTRLMDFQMLPSNLKNELTHKFNNFI
jgi:hypothetical protein